MRHRRTIPSDTTSSVVVARDLDVLENLAWAGFLSTGQIARLHFPSRRMAQRRLRTLLDHGLVRASLQGPALQRDTLFAVTQQGVERLREERTYANSDHLRPGRLPRVSKATHEVAVRDILVAFVLADRRGEVELADIRFGQDAAPELRSVGLVPDALISLRDGRRVAAEVDRGTETTTTLRQKFRNYLGPISQGLELLVLAEREGRQRTIHRLLGEVGVRRRVLVTGGEALENTLRTRGAYAPPIRAERTASLPRQSRIRLLEDTPTRRV